MKHSVIVVGAGAVGLSIAWELARRNCEVTLLDRDAVGRGTTWTAAGILPPANFEQSTDPIDRLRGLSHQLYQRWSEKLLAETSIDIGLHRCGGWYLADSPAERAVMVGMTQYWNEMSIQCDSVSLDRLADQEPGLSQWAAQNPDTAAWWVPDEYQVRPPHLVQALRSACEKAGVTIRENCKVIDLFGDRPSNSASVILEDQTKLVANDVVVCSGVWSGTVAEKLNLNHALIPIRGQMLLLKSSQPDLRSVINVGNRYVVARSDGHTLIGSCEEEVGFDLSTDDATLDRLYDFAVTMVPSLRQATRVSAWSGLRPMTFDQFPMIGGVPDQPGLWVAAGHYRSGIHLAPATAVALVDTMLGKKPAVNLEAFRIGKQQTK